MQQTWFGTDRLDRQDKNLYSFSSSSPPLSPLPSPPSPACPCLSAASYLSQTLPLRHCCHAGLTCTTHLPLPPPLALEDRQARTGWDSSVVAWRHGHGVAWAVAGGLGVTDFQVGSGSVLGQAWHGVVDGTWCPSHGAILLLSSLSCLPAMWWHVTFFPQAHPTAAPSSPSSALPLLFFSQHMPSQQWGNFGGCLVPTCLYTFLCSQSCFWDPALFLLPPPLHAHAYFSQGTGRRQAGQHHSQTFFPWWATPVLTTWHEKQDRQTRQVRQARLGDRQAGRFTPTTYHHFFLTTYHRLPHTPSPFPLSTLHPPASTYLPYLPLLSCILSDMACRHLGC